MENKKHLPMMGVGPVYGAGIICSISGSPASGCCLACLLTGLFVMML